MFSDLSKDIDLEIENQGKIAKRIEKRLSELDKCERKTLIAKVIKGKTRYYTSQYVNGKEERTYLGKKDEKYRKELQELYCLEIAKKMCAENIELLEWIKRDYNELDPEIICKDAPLAYQEQENANNLIIRYGSNNRWKQRKLEYKERFKPYRPEELKHVASDGTITRSKSEALIANLLSAKDIAYVYECPIKLGDALRSPDFTIYDRRRNREVILEHMGMMNSTDYRVAQSEKLGLYIANGYIPNVNLILTFDDASGRINIPAISKVIDAVFSE